MGKISSGILRLINFSLFNYSYINSEKIHKYISESKNISKQIEVELFSWVGVQKLLGGKKSKKNSERIEIGKI